MLAKDLGGLSQLCCPLSCGVWGPHHLLWGDTVECLCVLYCEREHNGTCVSLRASLACECRCLHCPREMNSPHSMPPGCGFTGIQFGISERLLLADDHTQVCLPDSLLSLYELELLSFVCVCVVYAHICVNGGHWALYLPQKSILTQMSHCHSLGRLRRCETTRVQSWG